MTVLTGSDVNMEGIPIIKDNIRYNNLRKAAFNKLGNKCMRCGFSDQRALQIDHISGSGTQEIRRKGHATVYKEIIVGRTEYQLLCANCNWIKRSENNETKSKVTQITIDYINSLGLESLLEKATERKGDTRLKCEKCGSENISKFTSLFGEATKGYKIERYLCRDCQHNGFYKVKAYMVG